jgi:acetyl-CoA synthase
MTTPTTSCGCFECIVAIIPECNGVMVVNREYQGITPIGLDFTTLASMVSGGIQTPGFLGIAKQYLLSKKFLVAEGGLKRVVWMTKELKELFYTKLKIREKELGEDNLVEKIADETIAIDIQKLLEYLHKVNHPVLKLSQLLV